MRLAVVILATGVALWAGTLVFLLSASDPSLEPLRWTGLGIVGVAALTALVYSLYTAISRSYDRDVEAIRQRLS